MDPKQISLIFFKNTKTPTTIELKTAIKTAPAATFLAISALGWYSSVKISTETQLQY